MIFHSYVSLPEHSRNMFKCGTGKSKDQVFFIPGSHQHHQPPGMAGRVAGHVQWSTYYSYLQAPQAIYCRKNPYDHPFTVGNQELRHHPLVARRWRTL